MKAKNEEEDPLLLNALDDLSDLLPLRIRGDQVQKEG